MIVALLGLLAALGFWFLIGLVLYVVVGSVRRDLEAQRRRQEIADRQDRASDRYELYEAALGPVEAPILNHWLTVLPPHGDPP